MSCAIFRAVELWVHPPDAGPVPHLHGQIHRGIQRCHVQAVLYSGQHTVDTKNKASSRMFIYCFCFLLYILKADNGSQIRKFISVTE